MTRDYATVKYAPCPESGDTHCERLAVDPPGGFPGTYLVTATASDDSGNSIRYTFTADNGADVPIVVGPLQQDSASFQLTAGTWMISASVDDIPECPDEAPDAICNPVVVIVEPPDMGLFLRGDCNDDGKLDIADVIKFLNYQFVGSEILECPDACDTDDDGELAITDAIRSLKYQFTGTASIPEPPGPIECGPDVNEDSFPPCEYPPESCP